MEFKGTKGKWELIYLREQIIGISTNLPINGNIICEKPTLLNSCENWYANAQLISKAPEMLEMLIKVYHTLQNEGFNETRVEIEQLIKQATEL